ncbi:MAG: 16S rRNA (cytosine(967)-C(5))-methyltransferase RsmB [Acidobacteriota bacterium]|nr:16S rRNA (cytosine(967)-C(5))-methyltransferase RsmB [Acidobacteriota bacterium]
MATSLAAEVMQVSPARKLAFDILLKVQIADAYASELLHSESAGKISSGDHGLATELVMGVLRWRSLLDKNIAKHSSLSLQKLDPEVLTSLRMAAYQLSFLDRIPQRAVVHEGVELVRIARKRSAVPFTNAVLRKMTKSSPGDLPSASNGAAELSPPELSQSFAHPLWMVERWVQSFGFATTQKICEHNQTVPQTCIRFGDGLAEREMVKELERENVRLAPGRLLNSSRYVASGDVTATAAFRTGRITIQDEGSQLVALLVGKGANILDCCAAPGGKTRVLAEKNPAATVVAAELHPHRAQLLRRLVPAENVQVVTADVLDLPIERLFDRVLADVPCSGSGTLARHPEIKWRLKKADLLELQTTQVAILRAAMKYVSSGGRLIYSTCSLEPEENSEVVEAALSENSKFRIVDCQPELERMRIEGEVAWPKIDSLVSGPYLRTIPGAHPCDGFLAAILEKCA